MQGKAFYWSALLLTFWCLGAYGQVGEIDSLRVAAQKAGGGEKVRALNALAFRLILVRVHEADSVSLLAQQLAARTKNTAGLAEATIYLGLSKALTGRRNEGLTNIRSGLQFAQAAARPDLKGYGQVQIGNIYRNEGNFDSARIWYDAAYETLSDSLYPAPLSVLYRNLARYHRLRFEPRQEFAFLIRALAIRERLRDKVLKADIFVLLSQWHLEQANPAEAKTFLNRAKAVRVDPSIVEIQKTIDYQEASILFSENQFTEALRMLYEVQKFYDDNGNHVQFVRLQLDLAEMLEELGNFDISLKNALDGLQMAEENAFLTEKIRALLIVSRNYYRIGQREDAQKFAAEALALAESKDLRSEVATALNLQGLILKAQGQAIAALEKFKQALAIRQQLKQTKGVGATLGNIGETYEALGQLEAALDAQLQSLAIKEEILHQSGLAWAYFDLGSVYTKMKNFTRAAYFLDKAEVKSRQTKSGVVLVNVYKTRRDLYQLTGDLAKALMYSRLYEELKDSVNSSAIANRVLGLQSAYELDRQSREIELLSKNKQMQQDQIIIQAGRIRQQRIIIGAVLIGLLLLAGLVYSLYQFNRRKDAVNAVLSQQNEEIQKQARALHLANLKLKELNQQLSEKQAEILSQTARLDETNKSLVMLNKELAEKTEELAAQSEELRESNDVITHLNQSLETKVLQRTEQLREAYQELDTFFYRSSHDFRRPLTTFMGLAEVAKITVKDASALELFQRVKETATSLDRMLIKLQSISNVGAEQQVAKSVSVRAYLENACHAHQRDLEQAGIRVFLQSGVENDIISYPALLNIVLENIIENAIQFRSRQGPKIELMAIEKDGGVMIRVSDNGQGIEPMYVHRVFEMFFRGHEQSKGNGLGLYIVKKAVEKLAGVVQFESTYQVGTQVTIWLPSHVGALG